MTKRVQNPKKAGRPSSFSPVIAEACVALAEKGKTDAEIAKAVGVSPPTLQNWRKAHSEFFATITAAKLMSDERVEQALFERAIGYSCQETDIRVVNGAIVETQIIKHYPPEVSAGIFWLKNRQPKKWRDKVEMGITDNDGKDVPPPDPQEIARRVAFLFAAASQA